MKTIKLTEEQLNRLIDIEKKQVKRELLEVLFSATGLDEYIAEKIDRHESTHHEP